MSLYDRIGGDYDIGRHADPYISQRIVSHLRPSLNGRYLDLACGTGNYTVALANHQIRLYGMDQSSQMLHVARQKDDSVAWCIGDAGTLPFRDESFDGVICVLAIHHFSKLQLVFAEVARVLSSGSFVVFTATSEQMNPAGQYPSPQSPPQ